MGVINNLFPSLLGYKNHKQCYSILILYVLYHPHSVFLICFIFIPFHFVSLIVLTTSYLQFIFTCLNQNFSWLIDR